MAKLTDIYVNDELKAKCRLLEKALQKFNRVIIAYSGGVDSHFLLRATLDYLSPENIIACIGVSESMPQKEYLHAVDLAEQLGVKVEMVHPHELSKPQYQANKPDRCYHCKTELYRLLDGIAKQQGYDALLCGTNADDLNDYRPGNQAGDDFDVQSPLADAGLTKDDIRQLSKKLDLTTWDKPATPCLASRIEYGLEITSQKLKQIEQAEEFLRQFNLKELRVRHHGKLARVEVPVDSLSKLTDRKTREEIVTYFKKLGFTYTCLDLQGFRSGSGNELLE